MTKTVTAYVSLGSNLDDPHRHVTLAVDDIQQHPHISVTACSHWYGSKAIGPGVQPDYINGAVAVRTPLSASSLLDALQQIENQHGRERTVTWGPRTLDLDLLWYNNENIQSSNLVVPHPRISERNFVLFPLRDIAADLPIRNGRSVNEFATVIGDHNIWKLTF